MVHLVLKYIESKSRNTEKKKKPDPIIKKERALPDKIAALICAYII